MSSCRIVALVLVFLRVSIGRLQAEFRTDTIVAELIHRDSPVSPFYNRSKTSSELLTEAVTRSLNRVNTFNSSLHFGKEGVIESVMIPDHDYYLMKIYIGFQELLVMASTASSFTWIQCDPCDICYHQDVDPFVLDSDDNYSEIPYDSPECRNLPNTSPGTSYMDSTSQPMCKYKYSYRDKVRTEGTFSIAKFHLDSGNKTLDFFPLMFGCCHQSEATFSSRVQGMVGLGHGHFSLISQLAKKYENMNIFSYCLLPIGTDDSSKIIFSDKSKLPEDQNFVSIPFTTKEDSPYYHLTLKHVSLGENRTAESKQNKDNMIIDSGTIMTYLEPTLFNEVRSFVKYTLATRSVRDSTKRFSLCYKKHNTYGLTFPDIILHFEDRRSVTLKPGNTFIEYNDNKICMMIVPSKEKEGVSILGSLAQVNFQVEYNLNSNKISFVHKADCTEFGI